MNQSIADASGSGDDRTARVSQHHRRRGRGDRSFGDLGVPRGAVVHRGAHEAAVESLRVLRRARLAMGGEVLLTRLSHTALYISLVMLHTNQTGCWK
jgi:hypothetical protein